MAACLLANLIYELDILFLNPHQISTFTFRPLRGEAVSRLCSVQVNSEQVSLESFEEAGEGLTSAGGSFHHCGARTEKSGDFVVPPIAFF